MAKKSGAAARTDGKRQGDRAGKPAKNRAKRTGVAGKTAAKRQANAKRSGRTKRAAGVRAGGKRALTGKGLRTDALAQWAAAFEASLAASPGTGYAVLLLAGCGGCGRADVAWAGKSIQKAGKPGESDELRWSPIARRIAPSAKRQDQLAGLLAVLGHRQRLAMLFKLLEGPATYASLQKATSMTAGPLYHHIAQLRLAGCIGPKNRDVYTLTDRGRKLAWMLRGLSDLVGTGR